MNIASPPPPSGGLAFRLHDGTTQTLGAPRRNLMIVIAGILAVLVLATTGKAYFATSMPGAVLYFADDPVALVATARDQFELTQRDREFADKLPDERIASGAAGEPVQARPRRKATLTLDEIAVRARRALLSDNLSADAFDLLARVAAAQDKSDLSLTYATAASRLSLHEGASNLIRASRALAAKDYAGAVVALDTQMRSSLNSTNQITPTLLKIAEEPEGLKSVVAILSSDPPWRDTFMAALPRSMTEAVTPLEIFKGLATSHPASRANIAAYLDELVRRKEYDAARYGYLQLLPPDQLGEVGLISNADFDKPPFGGPFDWHIKRGAGVKAEIVSQPDRPKDRALLLQFGSGRTSFEVLQYLMLTPGRYNFAVEARGELSGARGLVWRLICADEKRKLGETPMFLGQADSWVEMPAVFTVPAGCPVQVLTLLLDARAPSEQMASGTVWYDNMKIARVETPPPAATPDNARPAAGK